MQLAIIQNPYTKKPQELWNIINRQDERGEDAEFNEGGIELLKRQLGQNPRFVVK